MHRQLQAVRISVEMTILFGLLLLIDHALLYGDGFKAIEPNPYWLPVLIMALTYGVWLGLGAAVIATIIWLLAPHHAVGNLDHLDQLLKVSLLPMLWVVAGLVIGEVTTSRKARIREQAQQELTMARRQERMARALARLAEINRTLQIRIATEERTVGQAVSAAIGLTNADNRIDALTTLIALSAQTDDFTYYEVRGKQVLALFRGRTAHNRPNDLSRTELVQNMMADPVMMHHHRVGDGRPLSGLGVVALPIIYEGMDALTGVLVIHGFPQMQSADVRLTEARLAELSHLVDLLGDFLVVLGSGGVSELPVATAHMPKEKVA